MDAKKLISQILQEKKIENVFFVACGGSLTDLYNGHFFLQCESARIRTFWMNANEFLHALPKAFSANSLVIACSHSGNTAETVQAAQFAQEHGAYVVAMTFNAGSKLDKTMLDLMPGSPFKDEKMSAEQKAALNEKYGLDDPFLVRYLRYVGNMLHGDFGVSYAIQKNMPISRMLAARIPITVQIALQAALLGTFIGLILGIVAAIKRNSIWDTTATTISVLGVSLPSFVFALLLSYIFSYKLKLLPLLYTDKQAFSSTILPTISLSMFTVASIARYSRSELIEVMNSEYILLADSKGITRVRLILTHAIHNALIGVITVLAPLVVNLMTGSLVVEKAFSIPISCPAVCASVWSLPLRCPVIRSC